MLQRTATRFGLLLGLFVAVSYQQQLAELHTNCTNLANSYRAREGLPMLVRWESQEACADALAAQVVAGAATVDATSCGAMVSNLCSQLAELNSESIDSCLSSWWEQKNYVFFGFACLDSGTCSDYLNLRGYSTSTSQQYNSFDRIACGISFDEATKTGGLVILFGSASAQDFACGGEQTTHPQQPIVPDCVNITTSYATCATNPLSKGCNQFTSPFPLLANEAIVDSETNSALVSVQGTWISRADVRAVGGSMLVGTNPSGATYVQFDTTFTASRGEVFLWFVGGPDRDPSVLVVVNHADGPKNARVDMTTVEAGWVQIITVDDTSIFDFSQGVGSVMLFAPSSTGTIVADAIKVRIVLPSPSNTPSKTKSPSTTLSSSLSRSRSRSPSRSPSPTPSSSAPNTTLTVQVFDISASDSTTTTLFGSWERVWLATAFGGDCVVARAPSATSSSSPTTSAAQVQLPLPAGVWRLEMWVDTPWTNDGNVLVTFETAQETFSAQVNMSTSGDFWQFMAQVVVSSQTGGCTLSLTTTNAVGNITLDAIRAVFVSAAPVDGSPSSSVSTSKSVSRTATISPSQSVSHTKSASSSVSPSVLIPATVSFGVWLSEMNLNDFNTPPVPSIFALSVASLSPYVASCAVSSTTQVGSSMWIVIRVIVQSGEMEAQTVNQISAGVASRELDTVFVTRCLQAGIQTVPPDSTFSGIQWSPGSLSASPTLSPQLITATDDGNGGGLNKTATIALVCCIVVSFVALLAIALWTRPFAAKPDDADGMTVADTFKATTDVFGVGASQTLSVSFNDAASPLDPAQSLPLGFGGVGKSDSNAPASVGQSLPVLPLEITATHAPRLPLQGKTALAAAGRVPIVKPRMFQSPHDPEHNNVDTTNRHSNQRDQLNNDTDDDLGGERDDNSENEDRRFSNKINANRLLHAKHINKRGNADHSSPNDPPARNNQPAVVSETMKALAVLRASQNMHPMARETHLPTRVAHSADLTNTTKAQATHRISQNAVSMSAQPSTRTAARQLPPQMDIYPVPSNWK